MPDWTNFFSDYAAGTSTSDGWINISVPSVTQFQEEMNYAEFQRECEQQNQIYELQLLQEQAELEEERQLIKDKERYPLFFLKGGIV